MNLFWVAVGAVLGAVCRWQLGLWLNSWLHSFAMGTFFVNIAGCFLIGIAFGLSLQESHKLLFITGFLGSFTTFSALFAEIVEHILQEKWWNALTVFGLHTFGGLCATLLGIWVIRWL